MFSVTAAIFIPLVFQVGPATFYDQLKRQQCVTLHSLAHV